MSRTVESQDNTAEPNQAPEAENNYYVYGPLKWVIALTASLGAILEVIDVSIVNVALVYIEGNLGVTTTEVGWVATGYTIAAVIILPLSAWLGERFGRKRYFVFSLIGFTAASFACGFAPSFQILVISRIIQGLFGGGLLAKAQAILFQTFPPAEQAIAQAVFGVGVIAGPAIGPTLGGYLTETIGWRSIFFVNVPFGIAASVMSIMFLPKDPPQKNKQRADLPGILSLALWAGSLQTVLEQGQHDDWFASKLIKSLTATFVIGLMVFIGRELTTKAPAVELRVLRYRSLAAGSFFSMLLGIGLYGILFVIPIFAQSILGFDAWQTGLLLAPRALVSAVIMVTLGRVMNKIDARVIVTCGAVIFSFAAFQLQTINPNTGAEQLLIPLLLTGAAAPLMFLPLSLASLGPLPPNEVAAGSGFYNLARQFGGSIGIALLTTLLARREQFHRSILVDNISNYNPIFRQQLHQLTSFFERQGSEPSVAAKQALAEINNRLNTQAALLSYEDIFWMVGMLFLVALPLVLLLGKGAAHEKLPSAH
ncbi:MAG: DHA2 family efflux MFS transporter permease subunit [Chroococcidiopsidaceae cyanobacterium CP_BM_ER_R8_30]|nr:DHA2 family efflux MFS transporter permease subunit [Chroococcidiopsidaceae cyanobacterium CP_BM_ER_R8_30]